MVHYHQDAKFVYLTKTTNTTVIVKPKPGVKSSYKVRVAAYQGYPGTFSYIVDVAGSSMYYTIIYCVWGLYGEIRTFTLTLEVWPPRGSDLGTSFHYIDLIQFYCIEFCLRPLNVIRRKKYSKNLYSHCFNVYSLFQIWMNFPFVLKFKCHCELLILTRSIVNKAEIFLVKSGKEWNKAEIF